MSSTMASEFTLSLLRATLFTSAAIILALLVRRPLRRWGGATLAYQVWLVVPCVAVAALLPITTVPLLQAAPALRSVQTMAALAVPRTPAGIDMLLVIWIAGMAAMAGWFCLAYYTFLRQAGRLVPSGDVYVSATGAGPASVGLFRPRIIVPHDFGRRYAPLEQTLILFHEQTHIARNDALANLLACAFQCAFWFNPLVHLGVRCFRLDQEIACDAIVMRRHPRQRRAYAEALLKFHTGGAIVRTGVHCQWQAHHPTKERLMSLQLTPSGAVRRLVGRCIVALLAAGAIAGTLGARAEQAASAPSYLVQMALDAGGERSAPRILARAGEQFAVASGGWRLEMTVREAQAAGTVWLAGKIFKGNDVVSAPTLLARLDDKTTIKVGAGNDAVVLSLTVSPQP
jgi:beta-lactamase regulating signal transducer with metallopeptidase domain